MTEPAAAWADLREADVQLIKRVIPHRYPFLLIDRLRDIELGKSVVGIKNVTANEPQFEGHFPKMPIMPGVMIVEAMAQTAGVLVGLTRDLVDKNAMVYFMSIEKAKFRRKVGPGDTLELHLTVKRGSTKVWRFEGIAKVAGAVVAEAELTAMMSLEAN